MSSYAVDRLIANGFSPVGLKDKNLIDPFFKKEDCNFSDYSFAMLYAWSAHGTLFYRVIGETLVLARVLRGRIDLLYPPLGAETAEKFNTAISECAALFRDINAGRGGGPGHPQDGFSFKILSIDEKKLDFARRLLVAGFDSELHDDLPDYIYEYQKLIGLSGKKYKNMRENINKFIRSYPNHAIEQLNRENIPEVLRFLSRWYEENKPKRTIHLSELFDTNIINPEKNYVLESYQSRKMLRNFEALGLKGVCIKLYSSVVGFIIGERTNSDTFTVLIEKVDNEFFGLSQYLFREFILNESDAQFINTSDDSGMPGLRVMKESYQPLYFKKRYYLRLINR